MSLLDILKTPTLPRADEDTSNDEKYAVYLLGSKETTLPPKKDMERMMHTWLAGRTWDIAILPSSATLGIALDARGLLIHYDMYSPAPTIEQAEPMQIDTCTSGDRTYKLVHLDIKPDLEKDQWTHTEKKHFLGTSTFSAEVPYFLISKKELGDYMNDLTGTSFEMLRTMLNFFRTKSRTGLKNAVKQIKEEVEMISEEFDRHISHEKAEIARAQGDRASAQIHTLFENFRKRDENKRPYHSFMSLCFDSQRKLLGRITQEFLPYIDQVQPLRESDIAKEHKKYPVFGEKRIADHETYRKIIQARNNSQGLRKAYYSIKALTNIVSDLTKGIGNLTYIMSKYYAIKPDFEKRSSAFMTQREWDNIEEALQHMDPPVPKEELKNIGKSITRGARNIYFTAIGLTSLIALPIYAPAAIGIAGFGATDAAIRAYQKRDLLAPGIIGIIRRYMQKAKKE